MGSIPFEIFGKIDNVDGFKRAFLDAYTASCRYMKRHMRRCKSSSFSLSTRCIAVCSYLPIHSGSEMKANLLVGPTSIQSFPSLTTGQDFLHSCRHFLGLHFSALTIAIRVKASPSAPSFFPTFFLGGIAKQSLYRFFFDLLCCNNGSILCVLPIFCLATQQFRRCNSSCLLSITSSTLY